MSHCIQYNVVVIIIIIIIIIIIVVVIIKIIFKLVKDNFILFNLSVFIRLKQAFEGRSLHVHDYTIFFCKTDCK